MVSVSVYCPRKTTPLQYGTATKIFACFPQFPSVLPFVIEVGPSEGVCHPIAKAARASPSGFVLCVNPTPSKSPPKIFW